MGAQESVETLVSSMQRDLAELLRGERQRRGLKQVDVARKAGVSRPTVIAAEAGHGVSSQNLLAMMATLGLAFTRQPAQPAPQRPLLKDLMRAERERLAMLRGGSVMKTLVAPARPIPVQGMDVAAAGTTYRRPRLREIMAAERARMTELHTKVPT